MSDTGKHVLITSQDALVQLVVRLDERVDSLRQSIESLERVVRVLDRWHWKVMGSATILGVAAGLAGGLLGQVL